MRYAWQYNLVMHCSPDASSVHHNACDVVDSRAIFHFITSTVFAAQRKPDPKPSNKVVVIKRPPDGVIGSRLCPRVIAHQEYKTLSGILNSNFRGSYVVFFSSLFLQGFLMQSHTNNLRIIHSLPLV